MNTHFLFVKYDLEYDMLPTKYENLFYVKRDGVVHHYLRFSYKYKEYKRKISIGLSNRDAYKISLQIKEQILTNNQPAKYETVSTLFHKFIASKKNTAYSRFEKNNLSKFTTHFLSFENRPIQTISLQELQEFIDERCNIKPATLYQLKRLWIDIYSVSSCTNIAHKIEIPKFDNTVYFDIHIDDARRLYNAILNYTDAIYRSLFLFGIQGRRKAEIAYLKWSDIDFKNKKYYIRPEHNKARTHAIYNLSDEQIKALQDIKPINDYVHTNEMGNPLYFFSKRWKRLLIDNNIQDMRFHDLRHMLGCLAINEGFSEEYIAKALGHKTTAMVKRYSRLKDASASMVTDRVNALLSF